MTSPAMVVKIISPPMPAIASNGAIEVSGVSLGNRTVEGHLTHAYQKLDITSREQLPAALATPNVETTGSAATFA